ncbi:hypothetical protein, partial [Thiocystis violacea]|uniref:hypothetical protein n=1 Tax=Thiocystis violacea TaxID=13725 RepID=UPI001A9113A2
MMVDHRCLSYTKIGLTRFSVPPRLKPHAAADRIAQTALAELPEPVAFQPPAAQPALPQLLSGRRIAVAR